MTFSLTCMASELSRAVNLAAQISGNTKQLQILKSCMIEVKDGSATIAATDMDHAVRVTLAADGSGKVFIDTAMLAQKASALRPNVPVVISGDDPAFLHIVQGKTKWKLPVISASESAAFPTEITNTIKGKSVQIPASSLINAMQAVKTIVREGVANVINMGILLDMTDGFRAVGADTRGMAMVHLDAPVIGSTIIVPNNAVSVIAAIFRSADALDIIATPDALSIEADGVMYRTKLVGDAYADWRKAVDFQTKPLDGSAIVDAEHIAEAVKRATAIAEEKGKDGASLAVRLTFDNGELSATAKNRNGEEGVDYCPADGDQGSAMVNAGVLLSAIGSFASERLQITFATDQDKVAAIKIQPYPLTDWDNLRVIMPRRA